MSRHIVEQINKYVGEDDILFHLGDWSFSGIENIWNFRKQLKVKEIHLLIGNHDHHIKRDYELPNVYRTAPYSSILADGKPIGGEYPDYVLGRSLFTSVNDVLNVEIDEIPIFMNHYPTVKSDDTIENLINLHGHTHGTLPVREHWLDVGIDNAFILFREYKPFSWEDVKKHSRNEKKL